MIHEHDDAPDACDEIHRAAHALHHLSRDHPVGDVAIFRDLHRTEDRKIDVPAADHAETVGRGYIARAGELGDRLLAGIDDVGVDLGAAGVGPEAEHAVFRLERHIHAGGNIIGDQRWRSEEHTSELQSLMRIPYA